MRRVNKNLVFEKNKKRQNGKRLNIVNNIQEMKKIVNRLNKSCLDSRKNSTIQSMNKVEKYKKKDGGIIGRKIIMI